MTTNQKNEKTELVIALYPGMKAELVPGNKIVITIDKDETKRDLWDAQLELFLRDEKHNSFSHYFIRLLAAPTTRSCPRLWLLPLPECLTYTSIFFPLTQFAH